MRNQFIFFLMIGLLLAGCSNQEKQKTYQVGILSGLDFFYDTSDGFREKMAELGYVEGENIEYDIRKSNFDMEAYETILNEFMDDKVDLILVFPTEASQQAKIITEGTGIPVVFANAFTEDTGLVNNIRLPGGDMTGVRWDGPNLAMQRFEIMKELVPGSKRIFIPYLKDYPIVNSQLEVLRTRFMAENLTMIEIPVSNAVELEDALERYETYVDSSTDAILIIAEPLCVTPDSFLVLSKFASGHRIPLGGVYMEYEGYASLFGITPRSIPQGRQAAYLADKILRGNKAGSLPVVTAESFMHINYRLSQELGLNVSDRLLNMADEIIR